MEAERIIVRLTQPGLPIDERRRAIRSFAQINGWSPSDEIDEYPGTTEFANGHLVVEHGLDNTAVITFLDSRYPFEGLDRAQQLSVLSISYNNLVDRHLFPDRAGLRVAYTRTDPLQTAYFSRAEHRDIWRAQAFDVVSGRGPNPNLKGLDEALIDTISFWKRALATDLGSAVTIGAISNLFNSILFVRALEDHRRWQSGSRAPLANLFDTVDSRQRTLAAWVHRALTQLEVRQDTLQRLAVEPTDLRTFDSLPADTVQQLLMDFYKNRFAPYTYDFSLISKHALSRIYEHYVSLLRTEDSPQLRLFRDLPEEVSTRDIGGVYTPQYIARFFARFLRDNLTPRSFRAMRTIDPACGSGIFLRTLLEMQCDPLQDADLRERTKLAFSNISGIDVDPNACQATRLSLALLYLVLADQLPDSLTIENEESLAYFMQHPDLYESFDAVIANPPFISWDHLQPVMRERTRAFVRQYGRGRTDMSLAMLRLGLKALKPGGFLLYILPHSFLLADNAAPLRKYIASDFWVHVLVDLSEIPVFRGVGSYVVLLIVQKRATNLERPRATLVRCSEFVGHALEAALAGKCVSNEFYEVFGTEQQFFTEDSWLVMSSEQIQVQTKLSGFPTLGEFVEIREGLITGADDVFIRDSASVPEGEEDVWVPFLADRQMTRYRVPRRTGKVAFFPYAGERRLTERDIRRGFPGTWQYLKQHQGKLQHRLSVTRSDNPWWSPTRPRSPRSLLRPKIVSPHLILVPRFSLDERGKYAVSRSPILYPKREEGAHELLGFMLAVLNSTTVSWQLTVQSHKYSRGYLMLEPKTLKRLRVPDPSSVRFQHMRDLQDRLRARLAEPENEEAERGLDGLVARLYGLAQHHRSAIGMG